MILNHIILHLSNPTYQYLIKYLTVSDLTELVLGGELWD